MNLYRKTVKGRAYFSYRHPQTGDYSSLGSDYHLAVQAARTLNDRLIPLRDAAALVAKVEARRTKVADFSKTYRTVTLLARRTKRGKPLSDKTLHDYVLQLERFERDRGDLGIETITRRDIATFLEQFPTTMRNRYRTVLQGLFKHAIADGLREDNPVEATLRGTEVVGRDRLTRADVMFIYRRAAPWFRRVLTWALRTLQRREDLSALSYGDIIDGHWHCEQSKTGALLRIKLRPDLLETLEPDGTGPVFTKPHARSKRKLTLVSADMMTKEFSRLRPDGCSATFHELRAYGAELLRKKGIDPQALLGHVDPAMTRKYLDRHKKAWTEVET